MKTTEQIKTELKDALPVHFHKGDPEPRLTPFNYHALECLHADALSYINQLETDVSNLMGMLKSIERVNAENFAKNLELESRVPRWISVEERLPEQGAMVLCCTRYYIEVLQWDGKSGLWFGGLGTINSKEYVTHWMPLPEPPKEVAT